MNPPPEGVAVLRSFVIVGRLGVALDDERVQGIRQIGAILHAKAGSATVVKPVQTV